MDNKDDKRRQLIQAMLAQPEGATVAENAERNLLPWRQLVLHFSPLIGDIGFGALYGRTGRMLAKDYGWLTLGTSSQSLDALFHTLNDDLGRADPLLAAQANTALLVTFTGILSGMIGETLTTRLLDAAWAGEQKHTNAREQK